MKNLKFRAWDKKLKKIISQYHYEINPNGKAWYKVCPTNTDLNNIELMQYTGLKDKNGKEIYHKHLIINSSRNGGEPHIVEWSEKFGGWIGLYNKLEYLIAQELHEIEIVGTKFENPELL